MAKNARSATISLNSRLLRLNNGKYTVYELPATISLNSRLLRRSFAKVTENVISRHNLFEFTVTATDPRFFVHW